MGLVMTYNEGLYGILTGLTKSTDHPRGVFLLSLVQCRSVCSFLDSPFFKGTAVLCFEFFLHFISFSFFFFSLSLSLALSVSHSVARSCSTHLRKRGPKLEPWHRAECVFAKAFGGAALY